MNSPTAQLFRRAAWLFVSLLFLAGKSMAYSGHNSDSLTDPRLQSLVAQVEEMSEAELVLLIDSLFDAPDIPPVVLIRMKSQIDSLHSRQPKNQFGDFAIYPANRFYGSWDTRHPFSYGDSIFKADTLVQLDCGGGFCFPFEGPVTSRFGWRDSAMHRGVDIDLNRGDKVNAAFDGMVRFAGRSGGFGNVVIVRHYNGLETVYAHLWKIKVKPGDIVLSGELLGLGGSTGHSTGTHLHFETRFRGVAINPAYFISLEEHKMLASDYCIRRTRQGYTAYPEGQVLYTVKKGDNLSEISKQFGVSVRDLKKWNGFEGRYRLRAGDQLRVKAPGE